MLEGRVRGECPIRVFMELKYQVAYWLSLASLACMLLGALITRFPRFIAWFGKLPGDFSFQVGSHRVRLPLASLVAFGIILWLMALLIEPYFGVPASYRD